MTSQDDQFMIGGQPAPLIINIKDLENDTVNAVVGQALVIIGHDQQGIRHGGAQDVAIASFHPAHDDNATRYNAGFEFKSPGTTKAWVADHQSNRIYFTLVIH